MATLGKNQVFEIKNGDGTSFHNLVLRKSAVESIVMSLGDKISGDVYYKDNTLSVTMHEYITYNGVNYMLINPPTIVREGVVSDNSELRGMTKYSFVFYHPMCQLSNFPFTDVAVTSDESRYLSESKVFSWIGKPADFVGKMNKNLVGTEWIVEISSRFPQDKLNELSDVIPFDNATIADACKTFYNTWGVPYVVDKVASTEASYATGKRFKLVMGLPSNEIYENAAAEQQQTPFVFQMGHGVGLKNNSRTPRNNKIITRISGYGSENNIPYGYPQVRWYGTAGQSFTYGDHAGVYTNVTIGGVHFDKVVSYPIYKGILNGEYIELIKHPFTRTHLMPSVYRTTLFNKISLYNDLGEVNTDYDPDITLVDFYDAVYSSQYPYPNTINLQAPSYESHEFEDEKPELGEAHIISATPLNKDLTPASSWDDSLDDEGNYNQSYFQTVLPQLSFDLYACASITEEMQINMRSGACLGCTFTVQVDWDDYKQNFYDEEGNFAPNGSQRDLTKYPKSNQGSISLVLQKDNSTFGTLMPNMYQYPKGETSSGAGDGDTFVILGISLPESYILAAEDRLDVDMKSYMLENNEHYFDYPLKFDEDFLFHNENILSQIRPNTVVRFNYAGQTQALFVKQITIKYGEQQLPQYDITLTDNVEVVLNQIGQVAEDVEKLSTLIAILRQSYGKNVWNELAKKLSKTQDDTAAGYITMLKGLQVGANFVPDILGEGGVLRMRDDGKVELVTDILYARVKAYFDTVEIREYKHTGGNRIASVAGNKICRVEYIKVVDNEETIVDDASEADFFRCYFRASDGEETVRNNWVVGDLAYCHVTSIVNSSDNPEQKGLNQKHLWRLVIGRNTDGTLTEDDEAYIDLSNRSTETISGTSYTGYQSGSDIPTAQDDIIQLGNVNDTTRQGAIVEFVTGTDAPSYQIYQGINSFSLNNKNQIGFGYNTGTGRAYMNVYGDTYIGDRNRNTFLEYKQNGAGGVPELNIKAKIQILPNGSTIDGESISDYIKDNQNNYDDTEVQQAISDLNDAVGNLQDQIDGSIETLYGDVDPSVPANDPYKDYTTDEKEKHLGDMYYNSTTGYAYRYDKSVEEVGGEEVTTYFWQIIRDTGITQAIADAAAALGLAETKAKIFTTTAGTLPTPPYKINDVWVNATYPANGSTYSNEILKCVTARAQGATANIADWVKASKYTDDSSLQNFISATYDPTIAGLTEQVDRKIESWFQSADPSSDWYDDTQTPVLDVRADHVGDMWYSESTHLLKRYDSETTGEGEQAVTTYFWTTIQDQKAIDAYDNAAHAQDTADGKRRVFTAQPTKADAYDVGDLWVNATYPATGTKTYENDVLRCKTAKAAGANFNISHWQKASKYTDDSALTNFVNGDYADTIAALEGQLDKKAETWYQAADPSSDWYVVDPETQEVTTDTRADHVGDLWYKTSDDTTWYYNATTSGGTTTYEWKQQNVPLAVFDKIDGKADIFVSKPSTYNKYDMWIIESNTTTCPNTDVPIGCKRGDIVIAKNKRTNSYTKGDWEKKDRYTDDSAFNGYIDEMLNGSHTSGSSSIIAAATQRAIMSALGGSTIIEGGLMLTSMIALRQNTGTAETPQYTTWAGISGIYDNTLNEQDEYVGVKGHGIAAWYGGAKVDLEDKSNYWTEEQIAAWEALTDEQKAESPLAAKSLFRMDGSGYLATANISWNDRGQITIKNITTLSDSQNTNLLNELTTFNSAFKFATDGEGSTTAVYIKPQVPFETLYVGTTSANKKEVATQEWVGNNYVSTAFFRQLFRAFKPNATAGQADVEVEPNTIDATISNIKAMVGLWTEQYVSALGQGSDGGGGGASVLYGLNDVTPNATGDGVMGAQDGYVLTYNGSTHHWYAAATAEAYVLPQATANALGGIKIGYDGTTAKTYAVALDANGKAYVNVPWTDTTYTLPVATSSALGGIKIGYTSSGKNYAVQLSNQQAYVNVPWENTTYDAATQSANGLMSSTDKTKLDGIAENANNYSLPLAASGTRGGIKIGYTESGTNYAVKLSSEKAYVTVPWTNTWRGVYLGGTSKVDTGTSTKALNFVAGSNVTIDYAAAGTEEGQSGSDSYFNIKISSSYVDTWRNILLAGTQKLGTATNTKGLNFVADGKTTITFLAAGTGEGQSGSADYATIKISSSWRGIQNNLTSDSTTDSLSAKQGKALKGSITTLEGYFTNGVANKAEELNTTRTIWGQNFNGTANVSGNMTGVGNITMGSTDGTYIKIGDIYIGYDSTNSAIEIYKLGENNAHVAANLYAHGAISALGEGVDGGGGGTGDVTWDLLASSSDTRQIALSHLTTALSGYSTTSHTHTTTIATDSGTNQLTLAYGTKYKLTAGGTSFVFTMPSADDTNTWRNIYVGGTQQITTAVNTKGLNFAAGSNVSLSFAAAGTGSGQSGNANYGTITIAATDTTYSAGKGLRLLGTQFISDVPRVAKDSKVFGGMNTWIMEEYTQGANYNLPSNHWYHIMSTQGTDTAYGTQLALGMTTEGAYYRRYDNGTWKEWKSLINTNTTYSAGTGISLSGTTFSNSGVRATTINGNYLRVNTNGTNADLTIPYATTANQLNTFSIPFNRLTEQGGNGKQWSRLCTFTDTAITTTQKWYGKYAIFEMYTNGYGDINKVYLGRVSFNITMHGKTSFKGDYQIIRCVNLKKDSISLDHFKVVITDTTVEFFVKNDIWDTVISCQIIRQDGMSIGYNSTYTYTQADFETYCSGKKVVDATLDTLWVGNALNATKATQDSDGNAINTTYLKLSGGTMSNTNLVTNLNADLLDGLHLNRIVGTYTREQIDISPNFDNPSIQNGLFEMRVTSETTGETGTKPFNGFAPFLTLKVQNVMMQLAGGNSNGWFIRGKQSANVTMENTAWQQLARTTDNVASATKLQTSRTINGTSFDGSANITTANWGTARNISIADSDSTNTGSAVSVNGSAAVTLKLPSTIKATLSGNASTATTLQTSRTIWGQSFNGSANVTGDMSNVGGITFSDLADAAARNLLYQKMATNDYFRIRCGGTAANGGWVEIATADDGTEPIYVRQYTGVFSTETRTLTLLDSSGNTSIPNALSVGGNITAGSADDTYIQIGGARIVWDNTNKALKVIQSDNSTAANFYATGAISALGQGVDGGGGGGQGDVTWALLASQATGDRTIHSSYISGTLANYLPLAGGTMTGALTINPSNVSGYQDGIILNDKGTGASEALTIKWTSATYTTGNKLSADLANNKLIFHNGTSWYNVLTSGDSSVSKSGETLTVKINGTSYSLTNTNTTYSAGNGLSLNGTTFSIASNVLVQGSVIDTHHEGAGTVTLDGTNELFAFYDRGGTCDAYEVEQSATLTNQTLTRTSTAVAKLSANVFNGMVGYNQTDGIYSGEKFAVYDLALPANYPYGANFFWSFGNGSWKPAKMRVLVGAYSASGFTYISKYSTDSCPAYGKVSVSNGATGFNRLRIVVSKYSRLACFGVTFYDSRGLRTTFMNRCFDDAVYRNISPAKDNTWSLGTSSQRWKEVRAVNFYGTFNGTATKATQDSDGNTINSTYLKLSGGTLSGKLNIGSVTTSHATKLEVRTANTTANSVEWGIAVKNPYNDAANYKLGAGIRICLGSDTETTKFGGIAYIGTVTYFNSGKLAFYASGAERAYLTSENLYIGSNAVCHAGNSSVSKSGSTLTVKINGTSQSITDTNTWRGIQDNLTSSSNTTESLSAKQGYLLANGSARDNTKLPLAGGTLTGLLTVSSTGSNRATIHLISSADVPNDLYFGSNGTVHWSLTSRPSTEGNTFYLYNAINSTDALLFDKNSKAFFHSSVTASSFIKKNGTSSQFLKADGSVDSNSYVTSSGVTSVATGTGLTGGTITSTGTISINSTYQTYISNGNTAYGYFTDGVANKAACLYRGTTSLTTQDALNGFIETDKLKYGHWNNFTPTGLPSNGIVISGGWTSKSFGFQLAVDDDPTYKMYLRQRNGNGWYAWKQIPMGDGTGASGTWGINITGNAPKDGDGNTISSTYLKLSGGTLTGDLNIASTSGRSALSVVTPSDAPCDLWLGANNIGKWSLTCRASSESYNLDVYSYTTGAVNGGHIIVMETGGRTHFYESIHAAKHLCVGSDLATYNPNRAELDIVSSGAEPAELWYGVGGTRYWSICCRGGGEGYMYAFYTPSLGYAAQLDRNGNFQAAGGVTALSDERDKSVVGKPTLTVEQIAQMPAVLYRWNDGREDKSIHVGTLAQRWEGVLPEVVHKGLDARQTRSYNYGVAALISAITTARKVVDHEKEIAQLKNRVKALEDENEMLKTKLIA